MTASNDVRKARTRNPSLEVAPTKEAVIAADGVFLATPFRANEAVLHAVADELNGKILVDCTNPVGTGLTHGLKSVESGSEMVQKLVPTARVVKAFSIYGFENLEDNVYPALARHAGDDVLRPGRVRQEDGGRVDRPAWLGATRRGRTPTGPASRAHDALWVRMVRVDGATPHMVWAALRR